MKPLPWHDLTDSAQAAVCHAVETLAGGYTGRLVLDCNQGGVGSIVHERTVTRNADGSRSVEVRTYRTSDLKRAS